MSAAEHVQPSNVLTTGLVDVGKIVGGALRGGLGVLVDNGAAGRASTLRGLFHA